MSLSDIHPQIIFSSFINESLCLIRATVFYNVVYYILSSNGGRCEQNRTNLSLS
jgi:hypothetical protein